MRAFILEIKLDPPAMRQRHSDEVRVGGTVVVRLDQADRAVEPCFLGHARAPAACRCPAQDIPCWVMVFRRFWEIFVEAAMERVKGIEPSSSAWEAAALPLSYTRKAL